MENLKPHKHVEVIKAWADGHQIEERDPIGHIKLGGDYIDNDWHLKATPLWREDFEYRIYDPLREVKEAFERGEVCQAKNKSSSNATWIDFTKNDNLYRGLGFLWADSSEWRVKPKEEFKDNDWVINTFSGEVFRYEHGEYFGCNFKKATKQEVLNAPNYNGSATNEDFPFEKGDFIIDISSNNNIIQLQGSIVSVNGKCF